MDSKKPWQDIYSVSEWNTILKETAKDPMHGEKPSQLRGLLQAITSYHNIEKTCPTRAISRIKALDQVAWAANAMLGYDPLPAKTQTRRTNILPKPVHKVGFRTQRGGAVYQADLSLYLNTLYRRARKKAAYLSMMLQNTAYMDATATPKHFYDFVARERRKPNGDLLRVSATAKLERLDPAHRGFEFDESLSKGLTYVGTLVIEWINSNSPAPFFWWLEAHEFCTTSPNFAKPNTIERNVRSIYYGPLEKSAVYRVWCHGAHLFGRALNGTQGESIFDNTGALSSKTGHAFVWTKDGAILSHPHMSGTFHHSSLASGRRVRCAGTWVVEKGKIKQITNDSGHYKPTEKHFRTFVQALLQQGVIDPNLAQAVGTYETTKLSNPANYLSAAAYLQRTGAESAYVYRDSAALLHG